MTQAGLEAVTIRRVIAIDRPLSDLVAEAEAEADGHAFMRRMQAQWETGENRFTAAGEGFWAAYRGAELVAVGGLNVDPYTDQAGVCRLRHVYVTRTARRQGMATVLVHHVIAVARPQFEIMRLRTSSPAAARFYERLGFVRSNADKVTHLMDLGKPVANRRPGAD